jgi:hypothetical protein
MAKEVEEVKWHKTLMLALILVVIVAAYFWDRDRVQKRRAREEEQSRVFPWRVEQLTEVLLQRSSGPLRLVRSADESWGIEEPIKAKADQDRLKKLIEVLLNARKERNVDEKPEDLRQYGLDEPSVTITLNAGGTGEEKILQVGKQNPTEAYYYARLDNEEPVFLILNSLRQEATIDVFELRQKSLWEVSSKRVQEVTISSGEKELALKKDAEGQWRISEPASYKADSEALEGLLSRLASLKAVAFEDDPAKPLSELGLEPALQRVTLRLDDPEAEEALEIGREVSGEDDKHRVYVRVKGDKAIALVDADSLKGISSEIFDWRDKALLSFEPYRVKRFEISGPDRGLVCNKLSGDEWEIEEPRQLRASISKVYDVLWDLKRARVSRFLEEPPKTVSWGKPAADVKIWLEDVKEPIELVIAKGDPGSQDFYARAPAQEELVAVDPELVKNLEVTVMDLRDRRLLRFKEDSVRRIEVFWEGHTVEITREGQDWRLQKPLKESVEPAQILGFLWGLQEVKFEEELMNPVDPSTLGKDSPRIIVTLLGEDGETLARLVMGNAAGDRPNSVYAWLGDEPPVYLLDEEAVKDLKDNLEKIHPKVLGAGG